MWVTDGLFPPFLIPLFLLALCTPSTSHEAQHVLRDTQRGDVPSPAGTVWGWSRNGHQLLHGGHHPLPLSLPRLPGAGRGREHTGDNNGQEAEEPEAAAGSIPGEESRSLQARTNAGIKTAGDKREGAAVQNPLFAVPCRAGGAPAAGTARPRRSAVPAPPRRSRGVWMDGGREALPAPSAAGTAHIMTCRRRCRARWSEREKLRSQSEQRKGLMPVCLRKCRVSSSERANFQVQPSHVHL